MVAEPQFHLFSVLNAKTQISLSIGIAGRMRHDSTKSFMKVISTVLLITITMVIAYSMEVSFWINSHLSSERILPIHRETIHVAEYIYGTTSPVLLGEIKYPSHAYFRLKLRFRADSMTKKRRMSYAGCL
jgi:hypothetical protein